MPTNYLSGHLDGLLLAVLARGPGHGYALSQRLAARSGGELAVPEGSLYPALKRLEQRSWVTSSWATTEGRRRRVYRLTPTGQGELHRSTLAWRRFATAVTGVLGDPA